MNGRRGFFELFALGGCAFILSKAMLSFLLPPVETPTEGNPEWRLILSISYLGVVVVLLPKYHETISVLRDNWSLVALLLLALFSSYWAEMPDLVLRKSIGLFGTTMLGIALAVRFSFEDQLRILGWLFRIIAVLSLACIIFLPSYGVSDDGQWMGVFEHKNALGSIMGLSMLVEWVLPAVRGISKILRFSAFLLSAVLLLCADSITPVIALIGALVLIEMHKFAALRLRISLSAIFAGMSFIVVAGIATMLANGDAVMRAVGRSANLTGRTAIWSLVASFIPARPILGYGYAGFWLGASPESTAVNRFMGSLVMYSHNGYLETLLTLGAIGLLLTLIFLGTGLKRAVRFSEQSQNGAELWPLAFIFYFIVHNLGESTILIQDLEWAVCVACVAGTDPKLLSFHAQQEEFPLVSIEA